MKGRPGAGAELSVRTVESHQQRVYDKLGISGRHDLADALRNQGAAWTRHVARAGLPEPGPTDIDEGDRHSPVRSMRVVVIDVLAEDQPEMPFASDQHPVQAAPVSLTSLAVQG